MSLAVLELNDQSLQIRAGGGPVHAEPGFARITAEGVETGEEARALAWQEPQHSFNQYWCNLNQTPLAAKQKWARHHADIAFAQLKHLWDKAGSPESLIVLVPGSFTDLQISLILGLINALPSQVQAVMDNALAACLQLEGNTLFVDMQLHQTVLSLCRGEDDSLEIVDQEVFPDLGILQIYNSTARHISKLLIDSARYDPLHRPENEQAIFDQIPDWLTSLRWKPEVSAVVHSEHGELPFILRSEDVKRLVSERLVNVRSFIDRHPGCQIMLSGTSALLSGLSDEFVSSDVAGRSLGLDNSHDHLDLIREQVQSLYRVRKLSRPGQENVTRAPAERLATHVLYDDHALPLDKPVSIRILDQRLQLSNEIDKEAALTVVLRNQALEAVHDSPGMDTLLPRTCRPGDLIQVAGHQLRLIEVQSG